MKTIRIHNVDKWAKYNPTEGLSFIGFANRKIEIDLNAEGPASVVLVGDTGNTFLATIDGLARLEFIATEPVVDLMITSESEVWYFTNEGGEAAVSRPDAVSFTRMMTRRERNPQLERMMYEMRRNEQRREELLQAQAAEFAAWQAARAAEQAAAEQAAADAAAEAAAENAP